jgi:glucose/arabinose dehydrogenase
MMNVRAGCRALLLVAMGLAGTSLAAAETHYSTWHDFRVVTVADGLERPWSLAFLPDGDLLITEKPGRLRIVRDGRLLDEPVAGLPAIHSEGQGGLLDLVPHPGFMDNRWLYLSYSKPLAHGESSTAVIRGHLRDGRLEAVEELFEAQSRGSGHYGCRMAFDGEGHLFVTIGDRQAPPEGDLEAHPAQDLSNHHGVVLRLNEDGSVPPDNPFVGQAGALPEIWSYGHRNAQGLVVDAESGNVWITEHGPQGGDELNLIRPGLNYGWPVIGYGVNYQSGSAIHGGTHRDGMEQPETVWVPSIGVSGLALYRGNAFPNWRGSLLAGGLSGERLELLDLDGRKVVRMETVLQGIGRIRDVRVGPEGYVYLAIDNRDGKSSPVLRLEPVERRPVSR